MNFDKLLLSYVFWKGTNMNKTFILYILKWVFQIERL